MEGTKPRTVSSLGMFDLLKGIGMLAIVFAHTAELYPLGTNDVTPFAFALFAYREALMAAFFIASGYGFRKRSIHKCIEQQLKTLLKPYLYTAAGHHGAPRFHSPHSFRLVDAALSRIGQGLRRFPVGPAPHGHLLRAAVFSCGPMWYLVALMLAWVLLDVLLEIFPERYITPAVVGVTLLGWGVTLVWEAPFCIAQGMVSLPYLYIGYLAKKRRLFETPFPAEPRAGLIASALGVVAGVLLTQSTDCVSLGEWTMGPLSILLDGAVGYGIIRLFLKWQRRVDGPISHAIEWVGRRSLFIFCIHTVELTAILWYLMAAKYADHPVQGMLLQFVFSLVSIFAVTELLMRRKELGRKLRGGKPADKPRQRARPAAMRQNTEIPALWYPAILRADYSYF